MEINSCSRFVAPRRAFARLVLCLGFAFAGVMSLAAAEEAGKRSYDIPAGNAADALKQFSEQSGRGVMANGDLVKGIRTNTVRGEHSPVDALELLLADTGLVAIPDAKSGAFSIRKETAIESKNVNRAIAEMEKSGRPEQSVRTEKIGGEEVLKMPDYMVVGSKTLNADIRRTQNDMQPYVVFSREDIETSGASNIGEYLLKRLPMNSRQGSPITSDSIPLGGNNSSVTLRGLTAAETLILVDGRRAPRANTSGFAPGQADINGIPISAIERLEILPSTAGGIYGNGAVGGVINIIRKRDFTGIDFSLSYGGALRGGAETLRAEVSGGFTTANKRTQISFSASQTDSRPLNRDDNNLWQSGRALYDARTPGGIAQAGSTTNVRALTVGSVLSLVGSGQSLGSDHTYVPLGYAGVTSDGGAALVANAGKSNLDLANDFNGRKYSMRGAPRVWSANLNLRHEFSDRFNVFADFSISDNYLESTRSNSGSQFLLAGDAGNPFQQNILVISPYPGLEPAPLTARTHSWAVSAGGVLSIWKEWKAAFEYTVSDGKSNYSYNSASVLSGAYGTALRTGTLNVLRDLNTFPIDYSPYVVTNEPLAAGGPFETRQTTFSGRIAGPLFSIAGGPANFTGLLQQVRETTPANVINSASVFSGAVTSFKQYQAERSQRVNSLYAELSLPLVSQRNSAFAAQGLEVQASVRNDSAITHGAQPASSSVANFQPQFTYFTNDAKFTSFTVAGKWTPVRGLSLRASAATGLLLPAINQISSNPPALNQTSFDLDPLRGETLGATTRFTRLSGGNPDLRPEHSKSYSFGMIFDPKILPDLRISVDLTQIRKRDEIFTPTIPFLLANEAGYPTRISRSASTGNLSGPIIVVDTSNLNISRTAIDAVDINATYSIKTTTAGAFQAYVAATRQLHLQRQSLPTSPNIEQVDYNGGPLKWRGNAGLEWKLRNVTLGWDLQYYSSYSVRDFNDLTGASSQRNALLQGGERVRSQIYHDVFFRYKTGSATTSLFSGCDVVVSIENVLNAEPPVYVPGAGGGFGFSTYGDPRLRRFTISLGKHF